MSLFRFVAVICLLASIAWAAEPPHPGPRDSAQMLAYDTHTGQVLLFGGSGPDATVGGLWAWDGRRWTLLDEAGPPPRNSGVLVYDSHRKRTMLFGGRDGAGLALRDTWEWDGARWRQLSGARMGPTPHVHSVAAFDRKRGSVVLFGPVFEPDRMPRPLPSETWTWNGTTWKRMTSTGPSDCLPVGMFFDSSRKAVKLVVARLAPPDSNATSPWSSIECWEWNGAAWRQAPFLPAPMSTFAPNESAISDSPAKGPLVFDGASGATWQNGKRQPASANVSPGLRSGHALAYDARRRRVVLFGGTRVTATRRERLGDTWEWDGKRWENRH